MMFHDRADRLSPPVTKLPIKAIAEHDGWCDDPADPNYNRPIVRPYAASHEALWRDDGLYDLVVVLGHNRDPALAARSSCTWRGPTTARPRAVSPCAGTTCWLC